MPKYWAEGDVSTQFTVRYRLKTFILNVLYIYLSDHLKNIGLIDCWSRKNRDSTIVRLLAVPSVVFSPTALVDGRNFDPKYLLHTRCAVEISKLYIFVKHLVSNYIKIS